MQEPRHFLLFDYFSIFVEQILILSKNMESKWWYAPCPIVVAAAWIVNKI
jgi:hypothetical protein